MKKISLLSFGLMSLLTLVSCDAGGTISGLPTSQAPTSSQSSGPTLIDLAFSNAVYDYNDEPMGPTDNEIEVTKIYKLVFSLQSKTSSAGLIPQGGIDSRLSIQFADQELFQLNKNRLFGSLGGRTTMFCANDGSNLINCDFTLTTERLDSADLFVEIFSPSRLNTIDQQTFTLSFESLSNNYIYKIGSAPASQKVTLTFIFKLVQTTYTIVDPQLFFLESFGLTRIFIPDGLGPNDLSYIGYKPGTREVLISETPINVESSVSSLDVNFYNLYLQARNNNTNFVQSNPVEIHILYAENSDYKAETRIIMLDYASHHA
jgi:hypothetical protein